MRNLEAKFPLADLMAARAQAAALGFVERGILHQRDTFFAAPIGKLKLREQDDGAWLIHYRRDAQCELELSHYEIVAVSDPAALRAMLAAALGVRAEVNKRRTLLTRGNIRMHLDTVDKLGQFGEIEAVLAGDAKVEAYAAQVDEILTALGVKSDGLIRKSYFELGGGASAGG